MVLFASILDFCARALMHLRLRPKTVRLLKEGFAATPGYMFVSALIEIWRRPGKPGSAVKTGAADLSPAATRPRLSVAHLSR
jgi:hypothetical protein